MPKKNFPFEVEVAWRRDAGTLIFIPDNEAPEGHDEHAKLGVTFGVSAYFPAEQDTGAGDDWNGDIIQVEMRVFGDPMRVWRILRDGEERAALAFIKQHHHDDLWAAGAQYARSCWRGRAA